jgi:hypothetical protein
MGRLQEFGRSVIVLVAMVMMAASAAGTMLVVVRVLVLMGMTMMLVSMVVMMVLVSVVVMPVAVMVIMIADMGAAFGLERAIYRRHRAALTARQLRKSRIVLDIERIVRDLGETVVRAQVPGETHEA